MMSFAVFIFLAGISHAQEELPREDLTRNGRSLLAGELTPSEFSMKVRDLRAQAPLSIAEASYLTDLRKKLPESLRAEICVDPASPVCADTLTDRPHHPLLSTNPSQWPEPPPDLPRPEAPAKTWVSSWWIPALLGGVALSYGFRGKEIQISLP